MEPIFYIVVGAVAAYFGMIIAELQCLKHEIKEAEKKLNKPEDK